MLITILLSLMMMAALSMVLMGGAVVLGAWDGINNDYSFWQFFVRFMVMLLLLKAFDVICFFPACAILAWICTLL